MGIPKAPFVLFRLLLCRSKLFLILVGPGVGGFVSVTLRDYPLIEKAFLERFPRAGESFGRRIFISHMTTDDICGAYKRRAGIVYANRSNPRTHKVSGSVCAAHPAREV